MSGNAFRRLTIGAVAAVMSGGLITQTAHASTLDIDYLTPNVNNYSTGLSSSEKIGQSFSPTISGQLTSVAFVVQGNDCRGCSSLTIAVEGADSNNLPNGTRLATESINHYALPFLPGQVTTVNFTTPTSVEAGNRYTLVLEADAGARYTWYYAASTYPSEVWAPKGSGTWSSPQTANTPAFGIYITATQPSPVAEAPTSPAPTFEIALTPTDGTTCVNSRESATGGAWLTLPGANDCTPPAAKAGASLLGWSTTPDFPIAIAQRQVDNGWGAYETFGESGQLTGVFIPAGGYTLLSNDTNLYPIWSE